MGTDVTEVVETLPSSRTIKVHRPMCTELINLIDKVSKIFPEIEAARPRCSSGIEPFCLLNSAIGKAKLVLQYCSESSKLYLALTGNVILSRCKKSRSLLEQSLDQIQTMVPVMLAVKISRIISDLSSATFSLDPSEEEAGKVVRSLLQQYASATDSREESVIESIKNAASRLHITSHKALLIEKRSIKRLLDKIDDDEPQKKQILLFLMYLLKKYGDLIVREQIENACLQDEHPSSCASSCEQSSELDSRAKDGLNTVQANMLSRSIPPEEFKCPISLRLMYDPVVIASGETFERMWIQKWFDEGHDTCPKTKQMLSHLSMTPNTGMKDLIRKWCVAYELTLPDPHMQSAAVHSLETSSTSIASLSNSMNDLGLAVDFSNVSLGSLDTSPKSYSSHVKLTDGMKLMSAKTDDDSYRSQSGAYPHETDMGILFKLAALPWESQCKVVEDVRSHLKHNNPACHAMASENFVEPLLNFLKDAHDLQNVKAQRSGCLLLLAFLSKCRSGIPYLHEGAYSLLASLLDSEVIEEALSITELLSRHQRFRSEIAASGALASILKILDTQTRELQEPAIKILYNLSLNKDIRSLIASSECIPKLVPFFEDHAFARYCIAILKNLCDDQDARVSIAQTGGCIASIAKLLEIDSHEHQEHAVAVLLSLCSQRVQYCQLVMDEGVIPDLVSISINGNDKGKASAMELLRLLREIEYNDVKESSEPALDFTMDSINHSIEKKLPSKSPRFFRKLKSLFL